MYWRAMVDGSEINDVATLVIEDVPRCVLIVEPQEHPDIYTDPEFVNANRVVARIDRLDTYCTSEIYVRRVDGKRRVYVHRHQSLAEATGWVEGIIGRVLAEEWGWVDPGHELPCDLMEYDPASNDILAYFGVCDE